MPVLESALDPNSEEYRQNRDALLQAVEEFRAIEQQVRDTAEGKREKFEKRGQLLPHERVARLLDPGSPYLSLMNEAQTVDVLANAADTIGYEVLTSLGNRYARTYSA